MRSAAGGADEEGEGGQRERLAQIGEARESEVAHVAERERVGIGIGHQRVRDVALGGQRPGVQQQRKAGHGGERKYHADTCRGGGDPAAWRSVFAVAGHASADQQRIVAPWTLISDTGSSALFSDGRAASPT